MVLPLLQALYDPNRELAWKPSQYESALKDIELFSLSSQVYHLMKSKEIDQMPDFFVDRLREKHTKGLHQNLLMKHKEQESITKFESEGLHVIPLKGVHFAERYFGHFAARVCSDIDLLVPVSQLDRSIACIEEIGYDFEIIKDHHARLHNKEGLMIELHWTLDKQHWSDLHIEPFWRDAEALKNYRSVKQLSDLHTFYFICLHGARHQMDSMRYVLDIVQMIHHCGDRLDYKKLMEQAVIDKTNKRIQAALSIVYQQFPHLHEWKPLPFSVIETHWSYDVIRDAKLGIRTKNYFLYKFFFKHLIFDTIRHQMKSLRRAY
ncbi:nucleotidyltransferase family protein [Paenibacillus allorhizosphaerae]|uniref:Nucleotidyltransferase family protein n=1 Tax=Paenibacillus allorhizosphaerae TaxID=2849866 RepID=A0ABM8VFG0_9BACL|nr:nucleotidyltransferase family protein [Paenibacillus allorhizosphaerae]CAG7632596.1 hypothetical protein PAECIP111802_01861 [Paenibacillus allorhizosphaerae]